MLGLPGEGGGTSDYPCAETARCRPFGNPNPPAHLGHFLTLPSWIMWMAESSAVSLNREVEQQFWKEGSLVEETWISQPLWGSVAQDGEISSRTLRSSPLGFPKSSLCLTWPGPRSDVNPWPSLSQE